MPPLLSFIYILFCLVGLVIAFLLIANPVRMIELQIKFYEKINWRMVPISLPKEIRNTRIMGISLLTTILVTLSLVLIKS